MPRAGDHTPRPRVADVAEGVDGGESRDDEAPSSLMDTLPTPPSSPAPSRGPCRRSRRARAYAALLEVPAGRGGGLVAHRVVGADRGIPDDEVEEDCGGDQRDAGHPYVEPDAVLLQVADDPFGGCEAEGAPPVSRRAWVFRTVPWGPRRSVSRVPGEEPRTSTPTVAPSGSSKRTAVQPVRATGSVAWPTSTPGTSQRLPNTGLQESWCCEASGVSWPLLGVRGDHAGVVAGQAPERDELCSARVGPNRTKTESFTIE